MNRKIIIPVLLVLTAGIIILIVMDNRSTRPDRRPDNPWEYNIDEYRSVDPALILFREVRDIRLGPENPAGLAWYEGRLYIVDESNLQVITPDGHQVFRTELPKPPTCIHVAEPGIFIGFLRNPCLFDHSGKMVRNFDEPGDSAVITSLAFRDGQLYAADAGNRQIVRFHMDGWIAGTFNGKREESDLHGFIVPSPCFEVMFNPDGELWVVNPGMHSLENYSLDGQIRGYWSNTAISIEGFSGCCNPAHVAFLPDGSFVTAEKGLVRIKVYKPSGELLGVVAAPDKFTGGEKAPDLAVDDEGTVYALDFDRKMIRIFQHIR